MLCTRADCARACKTLQIKTSSLLKRDTSCYLYDPFYLTHGLRRDQRNLRLFIVILFGFTRRQIAQF